MRRFLSVLGVVLPFFSSAAFSAPLKAGQEDFVSANILGIFYHELGHAVIDVEALPIFGQEEIAADVFAVYAIDHLYGEVAARDIMGHVLAGFLAEVRMEQEEERELAFWDEHGLTQQRYYNSLCLFYGADPENRSDISVAFELPLEREEICPDVFDSARKSWGPVLEHLGTRADGYVLSLEISDQLNRDFQAVDVLGWEVELLNQRLRFSEPVVVAVEPCEEANAFYDPEGRRITFCVEYEDDLIHMAWEMR